MKARFFFSFLLFLFVVFPVQASAQEAHQDLQGVWSARVIEVLKEEVREIPATGVEATYQTLRAEILEGPQKGRQVLVENDFLNLRKGSSFFLAYLITQDGDAIYTVADADRRMSLYVLLGIFIGGIIVFGGWYGVRALVSLGISFLLVIYVLLPQLLKGYAPILVSVGVAGCILALAMYVTHGWNRKTHAAFLGTMGAVLFTGLLGYYFISYGMLSGFSSEESVYLNIDTQGQLNMANILLGAIIIGALGVLDDVAITQASAVEAIFKTQSKLSRKEVSKKAFVIGRDHVGALVNTLALAYVGASLPLLLLFSGNISEPVSYIMNREIFATEIIRTIIGSLGLLTAVPLTTFFAAFLIVPRQTK